MSIHKIYHPIYERFHFRSHGITPYLWPSNSIAYSGFVCVFAIIFCFSGLYSGCGGHQNVVVVVGHSLHSIKSVVREYEAKKIRCEWNYTEVNLINWWTPNILMNAFTLAWKSSEAQKRTHTAHGTQFSLVDGRWHKPFQRRRTSRRNILWGIENDVRSTVNEFNGCTAKTRTTSLKTWARFFSSSWLRLDEDDDDNENNKWDEYNIQAERPIWRCML